MIYDILPPKRNPAPKLYLQESVAVEVHRAASTDADLVSWCIQNGIGTIPDGHYILEITEAGAKTAPLY